MVPVIRTVASALRALGRPVVIDPILVSSTGFRVLRGTSIHALVNDLLPLATLVTPNIPEAEALVGFPLETEADAKAAARRIQEMGAKAVLLKGGHGTGDVVTDLLLDGRTWFRFTHPRIESRSTHGTGCALSAAVTAWLARGEPLNDAVERAIAFVTRAIERAPGLGAGNGPLGHRAAAK
jgi:hydroxymethylpyrimidine/phosphomethylpyrimidine kinase